MSLEWHNNPNGWPNIIGANGSRFHYYVGLDLRPKMANPDRPVALYHKLPGDPPKQNYWTVLDSFRTIAEAKAAAEAAEQAA